MAARLSARVSAMKAAYSSGVGGRAGGWVGGWLGGWVSVGNGPDGVEAAPRAGAEGDPDGPAPAGLGGLVIATPKVECPDILFCCSIIGCSMIGCFTFDPQSRMPG